MRGRLPGNIISCSAQMVVKAIQTDTGKIVATHNVTDKGLDLSEELAAQKAVASVAGKMANYLIEELEYRWHETAANQEQSLTLKIVNVTFKELLSFENALRKHIPSVQTLFRHHFDVTGQFAECEVITTSDARHFVTELGMIAFDQFNVEVLNRTPQVIDIRINQKLSRLRIANVTFKELLVVEDALQERIPSVQTVKRQHFDAAEKMADIEVTIAGDVQEFVKALGLMTFEGFEVEVLSQTAQGT